MLDLGAWAAEKYVVSDPIFDEEEVTEADHRPPHGGRGPRSDEQD